MPFSLAHAVRSDLLIKKSRFLGCVEPVRDRAEATHIVAGLRSAHPGAVHVCWALLTTRDSAAVDDGEPGGTAGRPMLNVLRHQDLQNVLATVVRYYGGIKLGAGGLVRAYTDAIAQPLIDAEKIEVQSYTALECQVPYAFEGVVRRIADQHGAELVEVLHQAQVQLSLLVNDNTLAQVRSAITESTQGQALLVQPLPSEE